MNNLLRYIELKSGFNDNGPAWIAKVTLSRTRTTVYFNGHALKKVKGGGVASNYVDIETGEAYWVSGIKKNGEDRHWAGSGRVLIETAVVEEYLRLRKLEALNPDRYEVTDSIAQTDIARFTKIENYSRWKWPDDDEE